MSRVRHLKYLHIPEAQFPTANEIELQWFKSDVTEAQLFDEQMHVCVKEADEAEAVPAKVRADISIKTQKMHDSFETVSWSCFFNEEMRAKYK